MVTPPNDSGTKAARMIAFFKVHKRAIALLILVWTALLLIMES